MNYLHLLVAVVVLHTTTAMSGGDVAPARRHKVPAAYIAEHIGQYETPVSYQGQIMAYQVLDVQIQNGYLMMQSYSEVLGRKRTRLDTRDLYLQSYDAESKSGTFISFPHSDATGAESAPRSYYFMLSRNGGDMSVKEISREGTGISQPVTFRKRD